MMEQTKADLKKGLDWMPRVLYVTALVGWGSGLLKRWGLACNGQRHYKDLDNENFIQDVCR